MSFSKKLASGELTAATIKECQLNWSGHGPGERFLCRLCGHKFQLGDLWRFVYANGGGPSHHGNFLACAKCDGPDILERAAKQEAEYERLRFLFGG